MKRDFEIWDYTFSEHNFQVRKSTKQDLQQSSHDNWLIMMCLDLFDGKTHCIEPNDLPELKRYQRVSRLFGLRKTLWNKDRYVFFTFVLTLLKYFQILPNNECCVRWIRKFY